MNNQYQPIVTFSKPRLSLKSGITYSLLLTCNVLSFMLTLLYTLNPNSHSLWNVFGLLLMLTLMVNLILAATGRVYRMIHFAYLILFILSMAVLPMVNTAFSVILTYIPSKSQASTFIMLLLLALGSVLSYLRMRSAVRFPTFSSDKPKTRFKSLCKTLLIFCFFIIVLAGVYVSFDILTRNDTGIFEVFLPEFALFLGWIFLAAGAVIFKLRNGNTRSLFNAIVLGVSIAVFIVCNIPLTSTPGMIRDANTHYEDAFGQSPQAIHHSSFMKTPFSLPTYFFGSPTDPYELSENKLFYEGTQGVDDGIQLYFDVYTPPTDSTDLPGNHSVLIRIHGGGWTIGDKGAGNNPQVNKYFASQGYVVFDIQYGLSDKDKFVNYSPVPENVTGDFSIDDMVRHIGLFTTYLADHATDYDGNLESVFISGASAGGQLSNAAALGITSGEYGDILDSRLNIKGLIPFYPAHGLAIKVGIQGSEALSDPALLVQEDSPPALIYQGTHDGIVDPAIADNFQEAYLQQNNSEVLLIKMPFGSHGSDFYYSSYYNQPFIYYMERFMLQYQ